MAGIYVHIPFCQSRCIYCDFCSTTLGVEWMSQYLFALRREMEARRHEAGPAPLATLYIGGGTPSLLPPALLEQLFEHILALFAFGPDAEITIEANPEDITPRWLQALAHTPANRISMGVQTFDDHLLSLLRRRHNAATALRAADLCRRAGYDNLSIDLMYGLPGQTIDSWERSLQTAKQLAPPHLSAYSLQYEPGTRLYDMREKGEVMEACEDLSVEMYHLLLAYAGQMGMEHYEVSNFALPGRRSRHNSSYWRQEPYWGFGPGAHSYDGHIRRRWNHTSLRDYIQATSDAPHGGETLTPEERYNETVFTRLRTSDGLPLSLLDPSRRAYLLSQARPHLSSGRLLLQGDVLRLSEQAVFVSDDIVSDLMQ